MYLLIHRRLSPTTKLTLKRSRTPLLGRCSVGAIPHAPYAPWLAAQCSPIEQSRLSWVLAWRSDCRCPPGMQFSDSYASTHNLCTICKVSRHEAMHATPLDTPPTLLRPPGLRRQTILTVGVHPRSATCLTYPLLSRSVSRPLAPVSCAVELAWSGMASSNIVARLAPPLAPPSASRARVGGPVGMLAPVQLLPALLV